MTPSGPRTSSPLARAAASLRRLLRGVQVVVGGPDYESYLAHLRAHHPGTAPMTREAFERERLERRTRPGSRCC